MTDEALSSIFGFSLRVEYAALNYEKNGVIRVKEKRMIYMQKLWVHWGGDSNIKVFGKGIKIMQLTQLLGRQIVTCGIFYCR